MTNQGDSVSVPEVPVWATEAEVVRLREENAQVLAANKHARDIGEQIADRANKAEALLVQAERERDEVRAQLCAAREALRPFGVFFRRMEKDVDYSYMS